jgi:hydrogenase nickel incorporation protein HypA/HybF
MHELSIVMSIVEIAEEQVRKNQAERVDEIELEIGQLSGIELDALHFAWDAAVRDTGLAKSECKIDHKVGIARCMNCQTEFETSELFCTCPECGEFFTEILQGKEMRVKALVVS